MSDYPVTKKDFTTKIDDEDVYQAVHVNDVQNEIRSVEDFIGTGKSEQLSLMQIFQSHVRGKVCTITSGDTISVPAREMIIDTRGVRNASALTRDLATDITASTSTDYYLFAVDDADGTFSLEFRAASTAVTGKRMIATVTTNGSDATVIDTIVDEDISRVGGKQTIWIPVEAITPAITNGCAVLALSESTTNKVNYNTLDFDASADEHAHFKIRFPKSWNLGTVTFKATWTSTGAVSTGVAIGLQAGAFADGDAIDTAYGTAVVVTDDAQGTADDLYITGESSDVTIAGTPAAEEDVEFRVFRDVSDGNDDMTQDMKLRGISIFFRTNAEDDT